MNLMTRFLVFFAAGTLISKYLLTLNLPTTTHFLYAFLIFIPVWGTIRLIEFGAKKLKEKYKIPSSGPISGKEWAIMGSTAVCFVAIKMLLGLPFWCLALAAVVIGIFLAVGEKHQ